VNYQDIVGATQGLFPMLQFLYLFGSEARGDSHPTSDLDLAIMLPDKLGALQRFDSGSALSITLGREVDLVDLRAASEVFRVQIIENGHLLYAENPLQVQYFEMYALSSYCRLNEERHEILKSFMAS